MNKVLVICGPTASGKTSLALSVASKLHSVSIISADSRQVYKELDIVSGKDIPYKLPENIHIFGLDLFSPDQVANLSEYVNYARQVIDDEISKGRQVILAGGTGLYLKGVTQNLEEIFIPINHSLRKELSELSINQLKEKLKTINPDKFNKLNNSDVNNSRRLIRYIEISLNDNKPKFYPIPKVKFHWIGLKYSKTNFEEIITQRVVERINSGAINEVGKIKNRYLDQKLPIFTALGVNEIISYLNKDISRDELISLWSRNEVAYAKRQMVWFKKQPDIIWYDESVDRNKLSNELADYLNNND